MAYDGLYATQHNAHMAAVQGSKLPSLPSTSDADGHPLWYDGRSQTEFLRTIVEWHVRKQYDDLDHLFDEWSDSQERAADGSWRLVTFHNAFPATFIRPGDWQEALDEVREWRQAKPNSRGAILAEALYWLQYAYLARGSGYANSVTPKGWRLFRERLLKADAILRQNKALAGSSPLWARLCLEVALGLDVPRQQMLEMFMEASKDGVLYYPRYTLPWRTRSRRAGAAVGSWSTASYERQ